MHSRTMSPANLGDLVGRFVHDGARTFVESLPKHPLWKLDGIAAKPHERPFNVLPRTNPGKRRPFLFAVSSLIAPA
jgi:hypothetical protein